MSKPASYYSGLNGALLGAVPVGVRSILDIGCGDGALGEALKNGHPGRRVYGVEREPKAARRAAERLDGVFELDIEREGPPINAGSLDCILFGDVLEHLLEPEAALTRCRSLLAPGGIVLCSIPNVQHHSILTALLTGDFQYTDAGLLDSTHLRFFTLSTMFKLLLDAGFLPDVADIIRVPCPPALISAAGPLLDHLGLNRALLRGTSTPISTSSAPDRSTPFATQAMRNKTRTPRRPQRSSAA